MGLGNACGNGNGTQQTKQILFEEYMGVMMGVCKGARGVRSTHILQNGG